jgi:exonuclease SbcD
MKFVHIGDLHLGRVIHQTSLLDIQRELLFELLEYMDQENIRFLVIAGDVYDRLIPSQEAVCLLDQFLEKALLTYHIEIVMISGNHDSRDRLHFASSIMSSMGLHIETYLKKEMVYIQNGQVRFYLLPFMKPTDVKNLYQEDDIHSYQEAMAYYLSKQHIDPNYCNVLITHQFVGKNSIVSDSELPLSVGGSEIIDSSLFQEFDYVALGHLHAPQQVSRETIRYSGSLMRYSFDEVHQQKSITVVDTDDMAIQLHELHPSQTLQKYKGTFEQFMDPLFISDKEDFLAFELEDHTVIPHAIDQLRTLYPHLLQITYTYFLQQQSQVSQRTIQKFEETKLHVLFSEFYQEMKQQELTLEQIGIVKELLEKAGVDNETH